jgi:adenylate cyclase
MHGPGEFTSAVDAVAGAVEVRRAMARRNAGTPPDRRIDYRVGVNIGDVIVDGDDIYGDGVNVAARLQALAEPGGVWISGAVHEHVRDKLPFAFADKGEQTVKNIARPVHVYALDADAVAAIGGTEPSLATPGSARPRYLRRVWPALAGTAATLLLAAGLSTVFRPAPPPQGPALVPGLSIVVLPFANLSGDPAQDYLADVITDELTSGLSRIRGSFVIARSSAFTYKGKAVDVTKVGRELGVRYVLEGSARQSGDQVRVNAQLISAETGAHLWATQFDTGRADLLTMEGRDRHASRALARDRDDRDRGVARRAGAAGQSRRRGLGHALQSRPRKLDARQRRACGGCCSLRARAAARWTQCGCAEHPSSEIHHSGNQRAKRGPEGGYPARR